MALSRFVVTSTVTVAPGVATPTSTGGETTPATAWSEIYPITFRRGDVIVADSVAGNGGASLLYSAIGSSNLRPAVAGTDDLGMSGISN